jgi:hypothetical protein
VGALTLVVILASWFVAPFVVPVTQSTYVVKLARVVEVVLDHGVDEPAGLVPCVPVAGP